MNLFFEFSNILKAYELKNENSNDIFLTTELNQSNHKLVVFYYCKFENLYRNITYFILFWFSGFVLLYYENKIRVND